jgi:hypothetical protein
VTRMQPMTPARRLRWTASMFGIALIFLVVASLTHEVWPLFVGWIPLLAVPWILTRPEAPEQAPPADPLTSAAPGDSRAPASTGQSETSDSD